MLLSIIIVNYNTYNLTCDCIKSIKDTTNIDYEIILIDNNSKDHCPKDFLALFPWIKLIPLQTNVGFGRANNYGMERAIGKYILLLNSDTVVHSNTIEETVNYLEQNTDVDILGCRVKLRDGSDQLTAYPYNGELNFFRTVLVLAKRNAIIKEILKPVHRLLHTRKRSHPNKVAADAKEEIRDSQLEKIIPNYFQGKRIGELVGVFLMFKKKVYLETRGFDPDFFMYYEELEWFLKRLRSYNIVYYPYASITHFHGQSDIHGAMKLNGHISYYLFWYKISYCHFLLFFLYNIFEIPSRFIVGALQMNLAHFKHIAVIIKAFPYVLTDIPRYSNKFGARKKMLKLRSLQD